MSRSLRRQMHGTHWIELMANTEGSTDRSSTRRQRTREIKRILAAILGLNMLVALGKIVVGFMSNSLSMTADGIHSLMDGASNVVGLVGIAAASRPPDPNHPYGHQRFETITSLGIALFLLLALQQILQGAWNRWQTGDTPEVGTLAFVVMFTALAISVTVTIWERRVGRRLNSSILLADARHTASDIMISISVIIGLILVRAGYPIADLILALIIAAAIAWAAWQIIRDAALTLSDVAVHSAEDIGRVARNVAGVQGVHNIRTRGGEGMTWVDMHIQVDANMAVDAAHEISSNVATRVEEEVGQPADVTVHIEPATEEHLRPERNYQPDEQ
jgi:cation diffusion facilitator family transporter